MDMHCIAKIDASNEFEVPTYVFYTSGAAALSLRLYVLTLVGDNN